MLPLLFLFLTPLPAQPKPVLTLEQIQARTQAWQRQWPQWIEHTTLPGKTREGRPIPVVRIGTPGQPELLWLSGIHPREQQPPYCVLRFVDELLESAKKGDGQAQRLLATRCLYLVPLFNVDGKLYEEGHPDWRKNRVLNADGTFGVDLNRNYPIRWGGGREIDTTWKDSTARPGADIYEGTSPLSEPENQALDGFFASHPKLRAFLDIHSPLREILFPAHSIPTEFIRYETLATEMQKRQRGEPYPISKARPGTEPAPGVRGGNSGLTYSHAYYSYGIYGFNFEISIPSKSKGVAGRYPAVPDIDKEYEANVKAPWLHFLEAAGELPLPQPGSVALSGNGTTDKPLTPGSTVGWTPPKTEGPCDYAILVSSGKEIVVPSEYRNMPLRTPFTIQVMPDAKPGTQVPFILHLWDKERRHTKYAFTLTVANGN